MKWDVLFTHLVVPRLQHLRCCLRFALLSVAVDVFTLLHLVVEHTTVSSDRITVTFHVPCDRDSVCTFLGAGASEAGVRGWDFTAFDLASVVLPVNWEYVTEATVRALDCWLNTSLSLSLSVCYSRQMNRTPLYNKYRIFHICDRLSSLKLSLTGV